MNKEIEEIEKYMRGIENERVWVGGYVANTEYQRLAILLSHIHLLEERVRELEEQNNNIEDFKRVFREIPCQLERKLKQAESRLEKLREAVDKLFDADNLKQGLDPSYFIDAKRELYKARKEVA